MNMSMIDWAIVAGFYVVLIAVGIYTKRFMRGVADFLGLDLSDAELRALAADVEPERALAFRRDPQLVRLYRETAHHPLMQRLEYGDLSCLPTS